MISPKASVLSVEDTSTSDMTLGTTTSGTSTDTVAMAISSQHKQEMDDLNSQLVSAREQICNLEEELCELRKEKEAYRFVVVAICCLNSVA